MFELSAFMDETGHSKEERQKFVGMAGLIATRADWAGFEREWKKALQSFDIPHFHMKDFAHFRGAFKGWSESDRRNIYGQLLEILRTTHVLPFGAVISMDDYRQLSEERQGIFDDPYFLAFAVCAVHALILMAPMPRDEKIGMVFSEQVEFRGRAIKLYEKVRKVHAAGQKLSRPEFGDMRDVVQLQGADVVAYELYKEFERRRYRPTAKQRHGYSDLLKIGLGSANFHPISFIGKDSLEEIVRVAEGGAPGYVLG